MTEERKVTTKVVRGFGHKVFVDGVEVGTITNYGNADWWALYPTRYPLGVWKLKDAAEKLAQDIETGRAFA